MTFEEWLFGFYGPYSTRYEWLKETFDKNDWKTQEKFLKAAYEEGRKVGYLEGREENLSTIRKYERMLGE